MRLPRPAASVLCIVLAAVTMACPRAAKAPPEAANTARSSEAAVALAGEPSAALPLEASIPSDAPPVYIPPASVPKYVPADGPPVFTFDGGVASEAPGTPPASEVWNFYTDERPASVAASVDSGAPGTLAVEDSYKPVESGSAVNLELVDEVAVIGSIPDVPAEPAPPPPSADAPPPRIELFTPERVPATGGTFGAAAPGAAGFPLKSLRVRGEVAGLVARTEVRQVFEGPADGPVDCEYRFPLPRGAAVHEIVLQAGARRIRGIVRPREEAEGIYRQARAEGKLVSLLLQERPDEIAVRLSGLAPSRSVEVSLSYVHEVPVEAGVPTYVLPLAAAARSGGPGPALDVEVMLRSGVPLGAIRAAGHGIQVQRKGPAEARVVLAPGSRDTGLVLRYDLVGPAIRTAVLAHRRGQDGHVLGMVVPPARGSVVPATPREITFIVDTSGSMLDACLAMAKAVVRRSLGTLGPADRFNIVRFSDGASHLAAAPLPATPSNLRLGLDFLDALDARGSSGMLAGTLDYLDLPADPASARIVCFLSDGMVGYDARILDAVATRGQSARWFTFGVGTTVNRYLLEGVARLGNGTMMLVPPYEGEEARVAVDTFLGHIAPAVLTDVTLSAEGIELQDVVPRRFPDLRLDRPVTFSARYTGPGAGRVVLRGRRGGEHVEIPMDVVLPERAEANAAVSLLWARRRMEELLVDLTASPGDLALRRAIVDIGMTHHLAGPCTSFVAVEPEPTVPPDPPRRVLLRREASGATGASGWWIAAWGLLVSGGPDGSLVVADVQEGSPAARSAIRPGDVIREIDGAPVATTDDMESRLRDAPGHVRLGVAAGSTDPTSPVWLERPPP